MQLLVIHLKTISSAFLMSLIFPGLLWSQENEILVLDEVLVTAREDPFANNKTNESMLLHETDMTNVNVVIDNLPSIVSTEGDIYGSDDWSSTLSIRGFQNNLDEQQIGMTIDGVPNGNSNYAGGAKASRFIDAPNLKGVNVWQVAADISNRSKEALGGTLDFLTEDPEYEERTQFRVTAGEFQAYKFYARYDTGEFKENTRAWLNFSHF